MKNQTEIRGFNSSLFVSIENHLSGTINLDQSCHDFFSVERFSTEFRSKFFALRKLVAQFCEKLSESETFSC